VFFSALKIRQNLRGIKSFVSYVSLQSIFSYVAPRESNSVTHFYVFQGKLKQTKTQRHNIVVVFFIKKTKASIITRQ
jgi:hypothetical protein